MSPTTKAHQIEPAGANGKFDAHGLIDGTVKLKPHFIAEEKKDDLRYLYQIYPNGARHHYLTSRRISKTTGKFVEKQTWCDKMMFQPIDRSFADTVIDGGIHGEGISSDVVHQMRCGTVDYCSFHLLMYKGRDVRGLTQRANKKMLREVVSELEIDWLSVTKTIPNSEIVATLEQELANGREGLMLKDPDAVYGKGWYKAKRKETFDVIIIGYNAPDSEIYASKGWIGQIRIGQMQKGGKIVDLGCVKNMTDKLRAQISSNKKAFINTVLEISAQERLKSGKFRNPSVLMLRPDKSPQMCLFQPKIEA